MIKLILFLTASFLLTQSVFGIAQGGHKDSRWENSLELRVVRCFKVKNVKVRCDGDVIPNSGGKVSAELEIVATDWNDKNFVYGYGKSIEGGLCAEHLTKIRRLVKDQDQVCIGGDGENVLADGETYARWRELETKLGEVKW